MEAVKFTAPEYQKDGSFLNTAFEYVGNEVKGWTVNREGAEWMNLGPGYRLLRPLSCGVCSTDLARRFLPYPLPQVIGHEVVCRDEEGLAVVEINASHLACGRDEAGSCAFCSAGLDTHCPERVTLGINRLPGGFAPYVLSPVAAVLPIPKGVSAEAAALTEPFAAALHAVEMAAPRDGDSVAVFGPRKLGSLILAALEGHRRRMKLNYTVAAVLKHPTLEPLCRRLGADDVLPVDSLEAAAVRYDVIFDTTGSPSALETASRCCRRLLHLKSTHGRPVSGLSHLTDFVVDELTLRPWSEEAEAGLGEGVVYLAPSVPDGVRERLLKGGRRVVQGKASEVELPAEGFPRFAAAFVTGAGELDEVVRPHEGREMSLVRPRGTILLCGTSPASPLLSTLLHSGVVLQSSRCGSFRRALQFFRDFPDIANVTTASLVTHHFPLSDIEEAFATAADSRKSIKVVVDVAEK